MPILRDQYAESRLDSPDGSGGTAGTVAGPGGESDETVRSATLSARARQLTPQAVEREAAWFRALREPGRDWRAWHQRSRRRPCWRPSPGAPWGRSRPAERR